MSMPLASIHDSVNISNEFLAYVGLAALVLGSALMYYATKKVVSPIPVSYTHLDVYKRQLPGQRKNKLPDRMPAEA